MTKIVLPNGVRVLTHPMSHTRAVSIGVWIEAGSRYETTEQAGLAHFIEHMMFKGTTDRTAKDLAIQFDRIGGNSNAYTSKEQTCYYTRVLDRYAENAVDLLSDMIWNSTFDEMEMDKEKQVIIEEINMVEDTPDDVVHEYLWDGIYPEHPLGHSILGTKETVTSFTRSDVMSFYQQMYHPSRIIISLAGAITPELMMIVEQRFGYKFCEDRSESSIHPPTFHSVSIETRKEVEQAHLTLAWPSVGVKERSIYATVLLQTMLGGSMSSRLFQEIREERGLAYSIYAYHNSYIDSGVFAIYGGTAADQLEELEEAVHQTIATVLKEGFTEQELIDAKQQIISNMYLSLESSSAWMNRLARNEVLFGEQRDIEEEEKNYRNVSLQDIQQAAELFQHTAARSVILPV